MSASLVYSGTPEQALDYPSLEDQSENNRGNRSYQPPCCKQTQGIVELSYELSYRQRKRYRVSSGENECEEKIIPNCNEDKYCRGGQPWRRKWKKYAKKGSTPTTAIYHRRFFE